MCKLSIITVNYNNVFGLQQTIDSVVAQKYNNMEYIIIDGSSTDGSLAVIQKNKKVLTHWISEKDLGVYNAMNKGIQFAKGEYIFFLNSGDLFYSSTILKEIEGHLIDKDIISFDINLKGENHDYIKSHPDEMSFSYLFEETLAHQAVFVKRELFRTVGLYDESLKITADWKFFIEAFTFHRVTYKTIHKILTVFYFGGMSSTGEGTNIRKQERRKVLKEDFPLFHNDYLMLKKMDSNRFKMLLELEKSKSAQKINSLILRLLLRFFRNKSLKDLK